MPDLTREETLEEGGQFRFTSSPLVHAPGLLASLFTQWKNGNDADRLQVVRILAAGWPTAPLGLMHDFLESKVSTTTEDDGETLVVHWKAPPAGY